MSPRVRCRAVQPVEQGDGGADLLLHDVVLLDRDGPAVVPAAAAGAAGARSRSGAGSAAAPGRCGRRGHRWRSVPGGPSAHRGAAVSRWRPARCAGARGPGSAPGRSSSPWLSSRPPAAMSDSTAATGRLGEPAQRGPRRVGSRQRFLQRPERRADAAVRAGQQFPQPQFQRQPAHWPGRGPSRRPGSRGRPGRCSHGSAAPPACPSRPA